MSLIVREKMVARKHSPTRAKIRARTPQSVPKQMSALNRTLSRSRLSRRPTKAKTSRKSVEAKPDMVIRIDKAISPVPSTQRRKIQRPSASAVSKSRADVGHRRSVDIACPASPCSEEKEIVVSDAGSVHDENSSIALNLPRDTSLKQPRASAHHRSITPSGGYRTTKPKSKQKRSRTPTVQRKFDRRSSMPVFTDKTRRNLFSEQVEYAWEKCLAESNDPFLQKPRVERTPPSPITPRFHFAHGGKGSLSLELDAREIRLFDSCSSISSDSASNSSMAISMQSSETQLFEGHFATTPRIMQTALCPPSSIMPIQRMAVPILSPESPAPPPSPAQPPITRDSRSSPSSLVLGVLNSSLPLPAMDDTEHKSAELFEKMNSLCMSYDELRGLVLQLCDSSRPEVFCDMPTACDAPKIDPKDVARWNSSQVAEWIESVNSEPEMLNDFRAYGQNVRHHDMRGLDLLNVSRHTLILLGVKKIGHQNAILRAVQTQFPRVTKQDAVDRLNVELEHTKQALGHTRDLVKHKTEQYNQAVQDHLDFLEQLQAQSAGFVQSIDKQWRRTEKVRKSVVPE